MRPWLSVLLSFRDCGRWIISRRFHDDLVFPFRFPLKSGVPQREFGSEALPERESENRKYKVSPRHNGLLEAVIARELPRKITFSVRCHLRSFVKIKFTTSRFWKNILKSRRQIRTGSGGQSDSNKSGSIRAAFWSTG